MPEVAMPRLGDMMEEGTVLSWLKADGETVEIGEPIAEIETDKATVSIEAEHAGELKTLVAAGTTVAVGVPIAQIGVTEDHADASSRADDAAPSAAAVPADSSSTTGAAAPATDGVPTAGRARRGPQVSPVARRLARELGVDLATVAGSGPGGRILRADVEAAARAASSGDGARTAAAGDDGSQQAAADRGAAPTRSDGARGAAERVPLTRVQQTIARRMAEAKATAPDFMIQVDVDMERCVALRAELRESGVSPTPTYNDMVVRACALALRELPHANASYHDGAFERWPRVNVGIAVAVDGGLLVPTVLDADRRTLREIAVETRRLAQRAREGTLTPPELAGGTFTVSNLGMFGVDRVYSVINPPQAAILGVGAIKPAPTARGDEVVVRRQACLTLTCDHRILYGADAATLLARVRDLLEQPLALLA